MTSIAEAKDLVELFWTEVEDNNYATRKMSLAQAKQCAIIMVDKMYDIASLNDNVQQMNHFSDVKIEIEKL
jgi:hypothetical protein